MKTVTEMTNNEVVENNLLYGLDGYVLTNNAIEMARALELSEQYQVACDMSVSSSKLSWM